MLTRQEKSKELAERTLVNGMRNHVKNLIVRSLYVLFRCNIARLAHTEARCNERHDVLAGEKIEKENRVDRDEGVGSEVLEGVVNGETVEWRAARGGGDVPKVSDSHQLRNLGRRYDGTKELGEPEGVVRVHKEVHEAVHEHATALRAGVIHDIQE